MCAVENCKGVWISGKEGKKLLVGPHRKAQYSIKASIIARNALIRGEGHSIVYGMENTGMQSSHCGRRS